MKNLIAIIIIAGMIFTAGYFVYTDLRSSSVPSPAAGLAVPAFSGSVSAPEPKADVSSGPTALERSDRSGGQIPEGAREYRNQAYGFSLLYPLELAAAERSEGASGRAATITFQNVEKAEGFQIFIVPYGETQVSEERFRQDLPSGVRKDLTDITVDGVTGAAFASVNEELGDTYEVWFIHNGFLYEVTTLKPLDAWLKEIMKSWKFGG